MRSDREPTEGSRTPELLSLERLRVVVDRVLQEVPEVAVAYAHGSRMTGTAAPMSDLDLVFVLQHEDDLLHDPLLPERISARIALELGTPMEIDGRLARDLPLALRGRVVTSGVLLYEADPVRRVEFETSTRRLYFDFLPFIERDAREALLSGG
jgi:predicted nucleotidyltransferase